MAMEITDLLISTERNGASDLHLAVGSPPLMRVDGDILPVKGDALSSDDIKAMLFSIMTEQQRSDFERDFELDFSITFGESMRFRVNVFNTIHGPGGVFRTIPTTLLTLGDLQAPAVFKKLARKHKGMILVTGPTGSGKSTTLAAMVDYINTNYCKHILTIEDPVEFVHRSKMSLINQREVGNSTQSFSNALKSSLREDPDIILVGEMRDLETIRLAMTAAETGHLVMGTLHTSSAAKTIDRIIDVFPADDKEMVRAMLSVSLEGIISQVLLKRNNGGRVAAHEILLGTPAVRNLIREGKVPQINSMMQMGSKLGMTTMKDSIYALMQKGIVDIDEAREMLNQNDDKDVVNPEEAYDSEGSKNDRSPKVQTSGSVF